MKITVELKDDTLNVSSDGFVKAREALKCMMAATVETLVMSLKSDIPPEELKSIFDDFGADMQKCAASRYQQLHGNKSNRLTDKEKDFLSALFKS